MFSYLLRRLVSGIVVLGIVSAIVFGIFFILPADPARLSCGKTCSEELILKIRHTLELDQTLPVQYGRYIKGIFVGRTYLSGTPAELNCSAPCLGYSFQTDQPVTALLKDRLPATASIAFGASILWLLLGLSSGIVSALRRGTSIANTLRGRGRNAVNLARKGALGTLVVAHLV